MGRNLGTLDRIVRLVIGGMLLGLYGAIESPWRYLTLLGLYPLGTALLGSCPVYSSLGISTRRHRPEQ